MADGMPAAGAAPVGSARRWFRWMNSSVSSRISASVLILTLVVGGALGWGSFLLSSKFIENDIARELAHESTLAAKQVEFTFNALYVDLSRLAGNNVFSDGITDRNVRNTYLLPFFAHYKSLTRIPVTLALYDTEGRLVAGAGGTPSPSYEGATWLKRVTLLGFTHTCSKTRKGRFTVLRQTMRRRWQAKLREVSTELRRRLHDPIPEQGAYLRSVILGHTRYYGVPRNGPSLTAFHAALARLWRVALMRRSQTAFVSWERMRRLLARWLPVPHVCHPYPNQRLAWITQGKSRMR